MKIKAVCEATGLTDRTIRYYIEEELISPAFTENYLCRKTYDFSESDVQNLNDIAVLRKFGFSIAEIKEMRLHPERIIQLSKELQVRKHAIIQDEQSLLATLARLDTSRTYTVSELASFLSKPVCEIPLPVEDSRPNIFRRVLSFVLFLITWFPVFLAVKVIFDYYHRYQYPVINGSTIMVITLLVIPTILILLVPKIKLKPLPMRIAKSILLIFCVLVTPLNYILTICAPSVSETSNHHYYRRFDSNSLVDRDMIVQDLFPVWPEYSDIKYYYCYSDDVFDDSCDIYAEWSLDAEDFATEVDRVHAIFEHWATSEDRFNSISVQNGKYTCFVLYSGCPPFEDPAGNYLYYIFGYDKHSMKVRYIHSYGVDQPYYLSLVW